MAIEIRPARVADIPEARDCLDIVARERRYLAMLEAPPLESSMAWWSGMIDQGWPFEIAVEVTGDASRVVGWCDITPEGHPVHRVDDIELDPEDPLVLEAAKRTGELIASELAAVTAD